MSASGVEAHAGSRLSLPRLHVIIGDDLLLGRDSQDFVRCVERVVQAGGGALALHIRGRSSPGRVVFERAKLAADLTGGAGAWLIVNDRVDVALALSVQGVHLREDSLPVAVVRSLLATYTRTPPDRTPSDRLVTVGRSFHNAESTVESVDYVIFGTVFETSSHPGRNGVGTAGVEQAVAKQKSPLLAIGGMTPSRVPDVLSAGAYGVVVKSGVWTHSDPGEAVISYLESFPPDPL